ncbi:MAG TPA: HD domain-containing protein [Candidatus Saccharimonadales bacterium]
MEDKIAALRAHLTELSANPDFVHHKWFMKWHLELVTRIALELRDHYPDADRTFVEVMALMHDYGKLLDPVNDHDPALADKGAEKLVELGFDADFAHRIAEAVKHMDRKMEVDLHEAPIEVQIVSSADACSHVTGPFMYLWWYENGDKSFEELMAGNIRKAKKDWERKVVLPEAREAFERYFDATFVQNGELPDRFVR